jgi:hypothetical protein
MDKQTEFKKKVFKSLPLPETYQATKKDTQLGNLRIR